MIRPICINAIISTTFRGQAEETVDPNIMIMRKLRDLKPADIDSVTTFRHLDGKTGHRLETPTHTISVVGDWLLMTRNKLTNLPWTANATHYAPDSYAKWNDALMTHTIKDTCKYLHELFKEIHKKNNPSWGRQMLQRLRKLIIKS